MIRSFSPQQPDRLVFQAPPATAEHVQQAADGSTQDAWWRAGPAHRADVLGQAGASLRARQDEAVDLVVAEVGKPLVEARSEVARAIAILNFYAQACYAPMGKTLPSNGLLFTERRPRGIAGLITPWNFGPLAVILTAKDTDDAITIASSVPHGLVTSIHGADIDSLLAVARRLDTGLIRINAPTTGVDFHAPFGGEKASSYGPREQGLSALDFYSSTRTITVAGAW